MNLDNLKTQQLQLLAKKSLLTADLSEIDKALGQIGAILQFAESLPKDAPSAEPVTPE